MTSEREWSQQPQILRTRYAELEGILPLCLRSRMHASLLEVRVCLTRLVLEA